MNELKNMFVEKLKTANKLLVFTGAGISAESGIATFRGEGGIWEKFKAEELANFNAFMSNPDLVWEWYQYRRKIINEAKPNKGHYAIAEMELYFESVKVSTQNVDNMHKRAGSKNVYELHGNIERNYCLKCRTFYNSADFNFEYNKAPKCKCGGLIRPDVVWFGETLPMEEFALSEKAASNSDIVFVVGTSAVVYPAAQIPISGKSSGAYVVEINIEETALTRFADYSIFGKSGEILPEICKLSKELKNIC